MTCPCGSASYDSASYDSASCDSAALGSASCGSAAVRYDKRPVGHPSGPSWAEPYGLGINSGT